MLDAVGLPYEQFTSCVVLPQGEFAEFLHAKPADAPGDPGQPARACTSTKTSSAGRRPARWQADAQLAAVDQLLAGLTTPSTRRWRAPRTGSTRWRRWPSEVDRRPCRSCSRRPTAAAAAARRVGPRSTPRSPLLDRCPYPPAGSRPWPPRLADARAAARPRRRRGRRGRGARGEAARRAGRRRRRGGADAAAARPRRAGGADRRGRRAARRRGRGRRRSTAPRRPRWRRPAPAPRARAADARGGPRGLPGRRRPPTGPRALRPHLHAGARLPGLRADGDHGPGAARGVGRRRPRRRPGQAAQGGRRGRRPGSWPSVRRRPARWSGPSTGRGPSTSSWPAGWPRSTSSSPARPTPAALAPRAQGPRHAAESPATTRPRALRAGPRATRAGAATARGGRRAAAARPPGATSTRPATRSPGSGRRRPPATTSRRRGRRWPTWQRPKWTIGGRRATSLATAAASAVDGGRRRPGAHRRAVRRRRAAGARPTTSGPPRSRSSGPPPRTTGSWSAGPRPPGCATSAPTHERDGQVAKALARHLRANNFERWLLEEALDALVAGASRILRELSSGQYDLVHDKGEFFVVDHHDAGAAPRRAHAVRRRDVPGVAGPGAGAVRAARRPVDRRGQPGVDHARRGLRHARRGHAGHGRRHAGEPGRPRRPDGRRGHPRAGAGRADPGPVRGQQGRADRARGAEWADGMGCHVDAWDPAYGAAFEGGAPAARSTRRSSTPTSSCRPPRGVPLDPPPTVRAPDVVLLVDGVRRIDASLWSGEDDGASHPGAGRLVRRRRGALRPARGVAEVARRRRSERGLFTAAPGARATWWPARSATSRQHVDSRRPGAAAAGRAAPG